jgi:hypothetical protein
MPEFYVQEIVTSSLAAEKLQSWQASYNFPSLHPVDYKNKRKFVLYFDVIVYTAVYFLVQSSWLMIFGLNIILHNTQSTILLPNTAKKT